MSDPKPTRSQGDLAETLEMLLDKGVVVNADIAVSVGSTELLGIELRAAIASFETAAKYGLEFPGGTDMDRVERVAGVSATDSENLDIHSDNQPAPDTAPEQEPTPDSPSGSTETTTGTE